MLNFLLTPLSAMSISHVRNCVNSSRAASSLSDLDTGHPKIAASDP